MLRALTYRLYLLFLENFVIISGSTLGEIMMFPYIFNGGPMKNRPDVLLILGSRGDAATVVSSGMLDVFEKNQIDLRVSIISAHRNDPELTDELNSTWGRNARVIIGIGGMALALPGAIAAKTNDERVVLGVALPSPERPDAHDATEAIIRLPEGTAVGFCGIGKPGLVNAAILACQIVAQLHAAGGNLTTVGNLALLRINLGNRKPAQCGVDLRKIVADQTAKTG